MGFEPHFLTRIQLAHDEGTGLIKTVSCVWVTDMHQL